MKTDELVRFLSDLRDNNTKEWFETHRPTYEALRAEFTELVSSIIDQSARFDSRLSGLDPKSCLFRINRDIRFSHDKSPYKTAFSAAFADGSKQEVHTGYYLRIDADGQLMVGAGVHDLMPPDLLKVRQFIAANYQELTKILANASAQGLDGLSGERLASVPRAFPADHPAGDYLKFKHFTIGRHEPVNDLPADLATHIARIFHVTQPFKEFLTQAIRS